MTLFKKLFSWMLVIFLIIAGTIVFIQISTTRDYLKEQQSIEINNTLNAMGLAMTPYLETQDDLAIESVIQALFDGGYYTKVKLTLFSDNRVIERHYQIKEIDVPDWFMSLPLFTKLSNKRVLTSGWLQLAEIEIEAHPGFAYKNLWVTLKQTLASFLILFFISMLALGLMLMKVLKPIKLMRKQAQRLSNNEFDRPLNLPATKDLRDLVYAFNHMSANLQEQFIAQARKAEELRDRAYKDSVTGLFNRDYFSNRIDAWLLESAIGGVGLLYSQKIKDIYDEYGYEEGDRAVKELTKILTHALEGEEIMIARISQCEFSLLIPGASEEELIDKGKRLVTLANDFHADPLGLTPESANIGLVLCEKASTLSEILSELDNALNQAIQQPDQPLYLIKHSEEENCFGKQQWLDLVQEMINHDNFKFKYQAATDKKGKNLHNELYTGFEKDGQYFSASKFLWAIEKQEIGITFDRFVINHMIEKLNKNKDLDPISINLTIASVTNASFVHWLGQQLELNPSLSERLFFEIQELATVRHKDATQILCEKIKDKHFKYGIDSYGRHFNSLDYLNDFRPDYVKIDYVYTNHLEDATRHDMLTLICRTAHNLGITTIATRVETKEQLEALSKLYVDGFQGFIFTEKNTDNI